MQGWHALALLACGLWVPRGGRLADCAAAAFAAGIVLFCGGVYAVGLLGVRLPMMAPMGGTLLMVGWLLLGVSASGRGATVGALSGTGCDFPSAWRRQWPVLPKPPSLRVVASRLSTSCQRTRTTGASTAWAIRAPRSTMNGASPAFSTITWISPR